MVEMEDLELSGSKTELFFEKFRVFWSDKGRGWRTGRRGLVRNAKYRVRTWILSLSVTDLRTSFLRAPTEFDKSLEIWCQYILEAWLATFSERSGQISGPESVFCSKIGQGSCDRFAYQNS